MEIRHRFSHICCRRHAFLPVIPIDYCFCLGIKYLKYLHHKAHIDMFPHVSVVIFLLSALLLNQCHYALNACRHSKLLPATRTWLRLGVISWESLVTWLLVTHAPGTNSIHKVLLLFIFERFGLPSFTKKKNVFSLYPAIHNGFCFIFC